MTSFHELPMPGEPAGIVPELALTPLVALASLRDFAVAFSIVICLVEPPRCFRCLGIVPITLRSVNSWLCQDAIYLARLCAADSAASRDAHGTSFGMQTELGGVSPKKRSSHITRGVAKCACRIQSIPEQGVRLCSCPYLLQELQTFA